MTVINIRNRPVQVDITEELSAHDFGHNAKWTADKLVASSPFRTDNAPSFFVALSGEYAGTWGDSGSLDEDYGSGNFVSLIAHLNGIGYGEACDYLIDKYGVLYEIKADEPIRIASPSLRNSRRRQLVLSESTVTDAISPYLITRGIGGDVQSEYGVGYNDLHKGFTAIPWHYADGSIANVKYRSTRGKRFFFEKSAEPIRSLLYGLAHVKSDEAVLVEGEIDVLSWAQSGYDAIACGGANLSKEQADLIQRSGLRRLYLGGDNDGQGRKLNRQATQLLRGHTELHTLDYAKEKDANDVLLRQGVEGLCDVIMRANRLQSISCRLT